MGFNPQQQKVDQWLLAISNASGMALRLNDQGLCHMKFGNQLTLVVEVPNDREAYYVYSPLIRIPDYGTKETLYAAMRMNLFQIETDGGVLSVDPKTDEIVYCITGMVDSLDSGSFQKMLDTFLTSAQVMKQKLLDVEPEKKLDEVREVPAGKSANPEDQLAQRAKRRQNNVDFMGIRP